jgi:DNA-binding LytR/AlgR family response regulator
VLRFSVKMENLLYLEASDNYVSIYYLNKEKVSRFMLRNTLKTLEEDLKGTEMVRCHRSYMVNYEKVKIIRREKDGVRLELDLPSAIDLPVTKTYMENVMKAFSHFSPQGDE